MQPCGLLRYIVTPMQATFNLAVCFDCGFGCVKDSATAFDLYHSAARQVSLEPKPKPKPNLNPNLTPNLTPNLNLNQPPLIAITPLPDRFRV